MTDNVHPAKINATPLERATRHTARISRLYQAIAQKGHSCPVEDLHAEIAYLQGELEALGLPVPQSHQEAADLWKKFDPLNVHAHHQAAHDEHGNQHDPDYPGIHAMAARLQSKGT